MKSEEHKQRILEKLRKEKNSLVSLFPQAVEEIIEGINASLDSYFVLSDDSEKMLRHREKKHHKEGIEILTEEFARKYGENYRDLIFNVATQHVLDDLGYIPQERDYQDPYFWQKWSAKIEAESML